MTDLLLDDAAFEQQLRAVLADLAPDAAPGSLRAAVAAVPRRGVRQARAEGGPCLPRSASPPPWWSRSRGSGCSPDNGCVLPGWRVPDRRRAHGGAQLIARDGDADVRRRDPGRIDGDEGPGPRGRGRDGGAPARLRRRPLLVVGQRRPDHVRGAAPAGRRDDGRRRCASCSGTTGVFSIALLGADPVDVGAHVTVPPLVHGGRRHRRPDRHRPGRDAYARPDVRRRGGGGPRRGHPDARGRVPRHRPRRDRGHRPRDQ